MHAAVHEVAVECAWKLTALLRSRRYHDVPRLMLLHKAQLLSYIEYRTPAIYHAAYSVLEPVDGVRQRFLKETCVSDEDALFVFHLALLSMTRRCQGRHWNCLTQVAELSNGWALCPAWFPKISQTAQNVICVAIRPPTRP